MPVLTNAADYSDDLGNRIVGAAKKQSNVKIVFGAKNCTIELADAVSLHGVTIMMEADGATVRIGRRSTFKGYVRMGLECTFSVGERLSITNHCTVSTAERAGVTIGDDCMFASHIELRADDSHPIFDRTTRERVNKSKPVVIGDHVWICNNVRVLKGSTIGAGCVIGSDSVVAGAVPENSLAAGNPLSVRRENIYWDKTHLGIAPPWEFATMDDLPAKG